MSVWNLLEIHPPVGQEKPFTGKYSLEAFLYKLPEEGAEEAASHREFLAAMSCRDPCMGDTVCPVGAWPGKAVGIAGAC